MVVLMILQQPFYSITLEFLQAGYYNDLLAQWNFPGQCGMSFMQCKFFLQQLTLVAMTKS
jgi:hypothetical protein